MTLEPFVLERYFAKHEFSAQYLLSSSDCEAFYMNELLESADARSLKLWKNLKLGIMQVHRAQRAYQQEAGVSYTTMHVVHECPLTPMQDFPLLPKAFGGLISTLTVSKT